MNTITQLLRNATAHLEDEEGAAMVEYGLLVFFIALAVIAVLVTLGPEISGMFQSVQDSIASNTSTTA